MAVKHDDPARIGAEAKQGRAEPQKVRDIHGYRVRLDETLPPTPLRDLLSAGGANVYLLSTDYDLLETVQNAAGEQYPVFQVDDFEELEAAIESGHCGIALVDAARLGNRLTAHIESLDRYAAHLVTLVAADRAEAESLIGLLSERKIHRLLIKPAAPGITRLLLESAVGRCLQLRDLAARNEATLIESAPLPTPSKLPRWAVVLGLAAVVTGVLIVATVAMRGSRQPTEVTEPVAATSAAPAAATDAAQPTAADHRFDDLLARANKALNEGRLAEPPGDNALEYYLTVLAADPDQAIARERLPVVLDALFTQAEADLLNGSFDATAQVLDEIRRADPTSPRLQFLATQLERSKAAAARPRVEAPRPPAPSAEASVSTATPAVAPTPASTAPAAEPRAPSELQSLLTIANVRLQHGQILDPTGDSAREYFDRAAQLAADDPRVLAMRARLAAAMVTAGGERLDFGDLDGAAELAIDARRYGADSPELTALETRVGAARAQQIRAAQEQLLVQARARLQSGALLTPANDSAFDYLNTLRSQAPSYPGLDAAWTQLEQALAARVTAAIASSDWSGAETALQSLRRVADPGSRTLADLSHRLETGRLQAQYLATAAPASELGLVSYEPPAYPADALRQNVEGWVELEFVVGRDGVPRDIAAVAAEPSGRFERSAIAAVTNYRYVPFVRDGETFERRVRLRVTFALK